MGSVLCFSPLFFLLFRVLWWVLETWLETVLPTGPLLSCPLAEIIIPLLYRTPWGHLGFQEWSCIWWMSPFFSPGDPHHSFPDQVLEPIAYFHPYLLPSVSSVWNISLQISISGQHLECERAIRLSVIGGSRWRYPLRNPEAKPMREHCDQGPHSG